jgi:monoamine oxidase
MARSNIFRELQRLVAIAREGDARGLSTPDALELARQGRLSTPSRRDVLAGLGAAALVGVSVGDRAAASGKVKRDSDVVIVGGGLAGLACLDTLAAGGLAPRLYEAAERVGGRCWSMGGAFSGPVDFPGQVVERGGELIDNLHKAMLGYAKRFKLTLEDVAKSKEIGAFYVGGRLVSEAEVVDELRALHSAMVGDLRRIGAPTALSYTADDEIFDWTDLATYLDDRGAGPIIRAVIEAAYVGEYGLQIEEQSCLAFLLFIHADRRSKFKPFGVFSDERYHIVEGNEAIVRGLAEDNAGHITVGHRLVAIADRAGGGYTLTFRSGGRTVTTTADQVVLTLPFSALRDVDTSKLALSSLKRRVLSELRYGNNSKQMIGFTSRPWRAAGFDGAVYGDLPNCTNTWETNPSKAGSDRGVLTDYSGGDRAARIDPRRSDVEAGRFLDDLDRVFPGAKVAARKSGRSFVSHIENWSRNDLAKGSYTANQPGYFTRLCDLEAIPEGQLYFAGEHTSSFYEWQGFMEGACLSGQRAAAEILATLKK